MNNTLSELYQMIKQRLTVIVTSPAQVTSEADCILQGVLNVSPSQRYAEGDRPVTNSEQLQVDSFLEQRISKRIPIQYLLHEVWFYGHRFYVNPQVLIPRPETELLVEQVLKQLQPGMRILDVGTGSGAIAIAISLKAGPAVQVVAVDASPAALKVAQLNQKMLKSTVDFRPAGNLFEALSPPAASAVVNTVHHKSIEPFDIIVSNPPYLDPLLKSDLMPEVLWHEPAQALFPPGDDPYFFYHQLATEGLHHLKPQGWMMLETGAGMTSDVAQILLGAGYTHTEILRDYAQLDRIVLVQRG